MDVKGTSIFLNLLRCDADSLSSNLDKKMKKVKFHISRIKKIPNNDVINGFGHLPVTNLYNFDIKNNPVNASK